MTEQLQPGPSVVPGNSAIASASVSTSASIAAAVAAATSAAASASASASAARAAAAAASASITGANSAPTTGDSRVSGSAASATPRAATKHATTKPKATKPSTATPRAAPNLSAKTAKLKKWWTSRTTKTITMILVVALVVFIVSKSIKPEEFKQAFEHMNPWWFAAAFAVGTLTWVGAAITMTIFAPIKVSFKDALLVQISSSFVGVVAPAGLGPLALSIRFLVKQSLTTAQAVATMILMELAQFLTSAVLVLAAIFVVGVDPDIKIKWDIVGWVALVVVIVVGIALAIKKVRDWGIKELTSVWQRVKPQAAWAFRHPRQLGVAVLGSLLQTASFAMAFLFSLFAFGAKVSLLKVGAAYLVANTLGSMIPVPGGVGSIEATLTVGMTAIGVPAAVALTGAVTFRLATFYLQIPIGWVAFQYMTRKQLL